MSARTCPAWCNSTRHDDRLLGDHHATIPQTAEGVTVQLIQDTTWGKPRLFLSPATATWKETALIPVHEAAPLASVFATLGHEDLAQLITRIAAAAAHEQAGREAGQ